MPTLFGHAFQALENGGRLGHGILFAADVDVMVARRHLHTQRLPNPSQVLVVRSQQGRQRFGIDNGNCVRFDSQQPDRSSRCRADGQRQHHSIDTHR